MKVHWIALLMVIGTACIVPGVSATIIEEKDGYIVTALDDSSFSRMSSLSVGTITQGQTDIYYTFVPSGKTAFSPNLYWGTAANSLSLSIVAPDSQLGPYYDSSDGRVDGIISVRISRPSGLSPGTWNSYVYGYQVTGSQSYSYTATVS